MVQPEGLQVAGLEQGAMLRQATMIDLQTVWLEAKVNVRRYFFVHSPH